MQVRTRLVTLAAIAGTLLAHHPARLEFDAASIKQRKEPYDFTAFRSVAGRIKITNYSVWSLIHQSYGLGPEPIEGAPDWVKFDRYDIAAVAEEAPGLSENQVWDRNLERVRSLLETRFHLKAHRETRIVPGYLLVVDKGGPKFKRSPPNATQSSFMGFKTGHAVATARGIDELAVYLQAHLGNRLVLDRTGLDGDYDFRLDFQDDEGFDTPPAAAGLNTPQPSAGEPGLPSLLTAVRTQLGLRLESKQIPTELLVIDHIERPTSN